MIKLLQDRLTHCARTEICRRAVKFHNMLPVKTWEIRGDGAGFGSGYGGCGSNGRGRGIGTGRGDDYLSIPNYSHGEGTGATKGAIGCFAPEVVLIG